MLHKANIEIILWFMGRKKLVWLAYDEDYSYLRMSGSPSTIKWNCYYSTDGKD
jgi:hypothetical protein